MNKRGLSTIFLVVIISVTSLLMATTASFLALGDLEMSSDYIGSKESLYLADSCLEDVLGRIQGDNSLELEDFSLSLNEGLCIINIDNVSGLKILNIKANINNYYREIEVLISYTDEIKIISYNLK
ncbi:MAG: hypothetical protein PF572_04895 [Patescibacteria group bacterium]|jgi:hypothetical protein|nr:hypothetical protein [Patescibacteria group bacterium]